jgi:hypothetical protein
MSEVIDGEEEDMTQQSPMNYNKHDKHTNYWTSDPRGVQAERSRVGRERLRATIAAGKTTNGRTRGRA